MLFLPHLALYFYSSCWKEDQSLQRNCPEHLVPPQHQPHGSSCILQPKRALNFITCHPSSTSKISRKFSSSSGSSSRSFFACGRHNLLARLRRKWRQQSRVNFDSQEDIPSSPTRSSERVGTIRSRRHFSSCKLSVVSFYRSNTLYETPQCSLNLLHAKEMQGFPDTQKRISFSEPEHGSKCFPNLETKAVSARYWTADRPSYPPSLTSSPFSLPTVMSSSSQVNVSVADGREHGQLTKDSEDALHLRPHSHSTNFSPSDLKQHLLQSITSTNLPKDGFSPVYKNVNSLNLEVTSRPFEEEGFAALPPKEDRPPPIEMTGMRSPRFSFL